jgi:diacylglycerol kinase family enzyme
MPDGAPDSRRRWAAAALALAAVGCAVVAAVVSTDLLGLALAVGSLFVTAFSAWVLVSRRGLLRFVVVPVLAAGLVGLVGFALDHTAELVVLVLATAAYGVAAAPALRSGPGPVAWPDDLPLRPARPVRHGVLIINPASGDGRAERVGLAGEAARRGVEIVVLGPGDDLRELAERAVAQGADAVGMAGGDGSQAVAASVAAGSGVAYVCVPAGTRNHFALDLGLDRNDVVGALDAFTDGLERSVDLAAVNGRVFVNNASLGAYADVVGSTGYRAAKLRTWRRRLPDVLAPGGVAALDYEVPAVGLPPDVTMLIVSNNPYRLATFAGAGTRPRLDTGRLGVLAVGLRRPGAVARIVTLAAFGRPGGRGDVRAWESARFEVRSPRPVPVGLDGESLELEPPLVFTSMPSALRVLVPARHPAGAIRLTRQSVGRLALITAGRLRRDSTG